MLRDARLAVIDLETTGSQPAWDRITEIALLEIDGFELAGQWSTLVNPGSSMPAAVQALTGISSEMVASAPRFAEVAAELYERLSGRLFIAHNAHFDYGFLRREFERAGLKFMAKTLCTVRLSRRLYAAHDGHDLDSLIARHGLVCPARHRALPDAQAVWQFLQLAAAEHGEDVLAVAARQVARQPVLPAHLDRAVIDAIPEAPGVYLLYGEAGAPLYVGKSISLRSRVLAHFCSGLRSRKATELVREVRRIDWQRTAGELGALLREARLVKELRPAYNRQLRRQDSPCGFTFDLKRLRLAKAHEIDAETLPHLYGPYRSRRHALQALRALADEHRLCLQALGFDGPRRVAGCWRYQLGKCAGVCAGKENVHVHHARLAAALAAWRAPPWPHHGPLGFIEHDRIRDATEVHIIDRWRYLGTAACEAEIADILDCARPPAFDYDEYRILARHLGRKGVRTVKLAAPCIAS
jgi:DNA polymerase III subunit epsilon